MSDKKQDQHPLFEFMGKCSKLEAAAALSMLLDLAKQGHFERFWFEAPITMPLSIATQNEAVLVVETHPHKWIGCASIWEGPKQFEKEERRMSTKSLLREMKRLAREGAIEQILALLENT